MLLAANDWRMVPHFATYDCKDWRRKQSAPRRELIMKIEDRVATACGCPPHPDETALVGTLTPPQEAIQ